jgi:hypothetical protein
MTIRPIFIFSAPRSGSTLLQRVLGAHSQIATASEPWLLLPLLSPLYDALPAPGPRDPLIREALEDFIAELPSGLEDYRSAIRQSALALYRRAAGPDATCFLDKTPLYHLIVDEIVATFPDARFLFLFRNPLSVIASCVQLFDDGRWEVARYHMALFQSFANLVPVADRYRRRSLTVQFEDLVTGDETRWRSIVEYLELPWEPQILEQFGQVELRGRMGDPTGTGSYMAFSREPVDKWRSTISNPLRRAWSARYLEWLGRDRLAVMGYDLEQLKDELRNAGGGHEQLLDDARRLTASVVREVIKARLPRYSSRASTWRALLRA